MPRKIVPLITDEFYHVYNRGVDKRDIFMSKADYLRFYQILNLFNVVDPVEHYESAINNHKSTEPKTKLVEVHAYALLPNHYHLILKQLVDGGISEYLKKVSGGYTSYFNQKQKRSGSLFQGKYKRVLVETDEQLNYLLTYVNENHVVHGLKVASEICYTSSLHYQGIARSVLLPLVRHPYNAIEGIKLAQDVFKHRLLVKSETLLE